MKSLEGGVLTEKRGIEVGNIFQLGYHYTNLMHDSEYTDENGTRQKYYMGCYGIGLGRTMAAIAETHHDEKGIVWPEDVAPYKMYIARLGESPDVIAAAEELYKDLTASGTLVLYDDRNGVRPGEKFADADLMGIPYRIVISDKTVAQDLYEVKRRTEKDAQLLDRENVINIAS
jgi:prolyl-tRNA synthetase